MVNCQRTMVSDWSTLTAMIPAEQDVQMRRFTAIEERARRSSKLLRTGRSSRSSRRAHARFEFGTHMFMPASFVHFGLL